MHSNLMNFISRNATRGAPQTFEIVKAARLLREDVNHEVDIIEQHPLGLLVSLRVSYAQAQTLEPLIDGIGDRLN